MTITAECNQCQQRYRLKSEYAGRALKCKKCGHRFKAVDVDTHEIEADESEELPRLRKVRPTKRVAKPKQRAPNTKSKPAAAKKQNNTIVVAAAATVGIALLLGGGFFVFKKVSSSIKDGRVAAQKKESLKYNGYLATQWLHFAEIGTSRHSHSDIAKARREAAVDPSSLDAMLTALGKEGFGRNFANEYLKRFEKKHLEGKKSVLVKHLTATHQPRTIHDQTPARMMSAMLLGKLGPDAQDVAPQLLATAESNEGDPGLKSVIYASLSQIGGASAESAMASKLDDPQTSHQEKLQSIAALGKMKVASAVPAIIDYYENADLKPEERRMCLISLGRIGKKTGLEKIRDTVIDTTKPKMERLDGTHALGEALNDFGVECLLQIANQPIDIDDIKHALIDSLMAYDGNPKTRSKRSRLIAGDNPNELDEPNLNAMQGLIQLAENDPSEHIQRAAIEALAGFGNPVIPTLQKLIASSSISNQVATLKAVAILGPDAEPLLPDIEKALMNFDPESDIVRNSQRVLGTAGFQNAVDQALFSIGSPAIPVLASALHHKDRNIQTETIATLVELKVDDQNIVSEILTLVGTKDSSLSSTAVDAIGQLNNQGIALPPATNDQLTVVIGHCAGFLKDTSKQIDIPTPPEPGMERLSRAEFPQLPPHLANRPGQRRVRTREEKQNDLLSAIEWATSELKSRGAAAKETLLTLEQLFAESEKTRKRIENAPLFSVGSINTQSGPGSLQPLQQLPGGIPSRDGNVRHGYRIDIDLQGNTKMLVYHEDDRLAQDWASVIRRAKTRLRATHQKVKQMEENFQQAIDAIK